MAGVTGAMRGTCRAPGIGIATSAVPRRPRLPNTPSNPVSRRTEARAAASTGQLALSEPEIQGSLGAQGNELEEPVENERVERSEEPEAKATGERRADPDPSRSSD
jgi:hypothetical protein